jgi:hypothetical protein
MIAAAIGAAIAKPSAMTHREASKCAKVSRERRQARSRRIESEARLENGSSPDEIAGPSKAKRKAGEHDRPHQADPLDGRQARVEFLLDSRKQYADATDALHVEKRSEANDQENA